MNIWGYLISQEGIAKGPKVNDVIEMPTPTDVTSLKSFLGAVQFYAKFLPSNFATITTPLYQLLKKGVTWKWTEKEQGSFNRLKELLSADNVLTHFDPKIPIGIACDASNVGIGAVLFHRFADGSERPICNVSKILSTTQQKYSQIQKEALSIIFGIKKFYQYIYGRKFILITDHRPLLALFGAEKQVPSLATNRLTRWAVTLSQYDFKIEYRKSANHGNADILSRLPVKEDTEFDNIEHFEDQELVCTINNINTKLSQLDFQLIQHETTKDSNLAAIIQFVQKGWPKQSKNESTAMQIFRKHRDQLSVLVLSALLLTLQINRWRNASS